MTIISLVLDLLSLAQLTPPTPSANPTACFLRLLASFIVSLHSFRSPTSKLVAALQMPPPPFCCCPPPRVGSQKVLQPPPRHICYRSILKVTCHRGRLCSLPFLTGVQTRHLQPSFHSQQGDLNCKSSAPVFTHKLLSEQTTIRVYIYFCLNLCILFPRLFSTCLHSAIASDFFSRTGLTLPPFCCFLSLPPPSG